MLDSRDSYAKVLQSQSAVSPSQTRVVSGRGRRGGRGRGRGTARQSSNLMVPPAVLRLRGSNSSLHSKGSVESDDYTLVTRKKVNKNRNVIMGSKSDCVIKGAPEPNRDLFIFRLDAETTEDKLRSFISDKGFKVNELELKSNEKAKYKSYRLRVPKSQFSRLFDENMWPAGVGIRKYFAPKDSQDTN